MKQFLSKSAEPFPISYSDINRLQEYQNQLINFMLFAKSDKQKTDLILHEIKYIEFRIKKTRIDIVLIEPELDNITVNSFNKSAPGL